ncbi:MAG: DHHA1 domain-containing protein [Bacteroidia bacterium]|nr:DHHA1 domain-containing protein [Bacteroidia bacterium]
MIYQGVLSRWTLSAHTKASSLGADIPVPIQQALYRRGVLTAQDVHRYFHPDPTHLLPVDALPDLDRALLILHEALSRGSFIFVVGDYDVDGTTSAALIGSFFRAIGHTAFYLHLPDRFKEGYGISDYAVSLALEKNTALFIAVDCGTKEGARLMRLKQAGMKVIVLDHHAMGEEDPFPPADAFVNPQRPDSEYPNPHLSAGALTYRVLEAYRERYGRPETWEGIDLAAISLLADIMPLVGENRTLVQLGLAQLQKSPRPGILALLETIALPPHSLGRSRSIVFQLVPRLNAPGRIHNPRSTLFLLLAEHYSDRLNQIAKYLDELNTYRQRLQQKAYQEALDYLELRYPGITSDVRLAPPALVVANPKWNKGILGLVASNLMERFYRPVAVFTQTNDGWVGSARSPAEVPLYEVLRSWCAPHLKRFGGHSRAAGLILYPEKLEAFTKSFQKGCAAYGELIPTNVMDASISVLDLQASNLANWVERFEPIGPQNEAPRFQLNGLYFWGEQEGRFHFGDGRVIYDARAEERGLARLRAHLNQRKGQALSLVITPRLSPSGRTHLRLRDVLLGNSD